MLLDADYRGRGTQTATEGTRWFLEELFDDFAPQKKRCMYSIEYFDETRLNKSKVIQKAHLKLQLHNPTF